MDRLLEDLLVGVDPCLEGRREIATLLGEEPHLLRQEAWRSLQLNWGALVPLLGDHCEEETVRLMCWLEEEDLPAWVRVDLELMLGVLMGVLHKVKVLAWLKPLLEGVQSFRLSEDPKVALLEDLPLEVRGASWEAQNCCSSLEDH